MSSGELLLEFGLLLLEFGLLLLQALGFLFFGLELLLVGGHLLFTFAGRLAAAAEFAHQQVAMFAFLQITRLEEALSFRVVPKRTLHAEISAMY